MNTKKPVILITHKPEADPLSWSLGGFYTIRSNYCRAIVNAGGIPIISASGDAAAYAECADGILFSGGSQDIDPLRYHDTVRDAKDINPEIDDVEFQLFEEFYKRKKPIMGICRGAQLINVALGGTLFQDLTKEGPHLSVHKAVFETKPREHLVKAAPGTLLFKLFGEELLTNSYHHQAVKDCGKGLIPSAVTEEGVIEAIEHETLPVFGVQWHPERMIGEEYLHRTNMMPLFEHFIKCCRK